MENKIYFDYNATTPCDPLVVEEMSPYFDNEFGNVSSIHHSFGWLAKEALDDSTKKIASSLNISSERIIYTSGGTEGINLVLKSFCKKYKHEGNHIITCKTEHKAVLDTCAFMERYEGVSVTYLDVDSSGLIDLDKLKAALRPETILVTIMYANNETGVLQPLEEIAKIIANKNIFLFTDATQALGKINLDTVFENADFACFSGHKIYGPKGVGMVYCKNMEALSVLKCLIQGGGQQKGMRGGTINLPGIVGFSKSIELSHSRLKKENSRLNLLRDQLESGLLKIEESYLNGHSVLRLPNTCNISFAYVNGASLLRALSKDIAVSNGSACNAASENPSHVLVAMGLETELAFSSLRFSLGKDSTQAEVLKVIQIVQEQVNFIRGNNILWERRTR